MALVTVYDAEGVEHQKETVDARECVQVLGYTYEKVIPKVEVIEDTPIIEEVVKQKRTKERVITDEVVI